MNGFPRLHPDSSPGLPWMNVGTTNSDVFGYDMVRGYQNVGELRLAVINRIQELQTGTSMDDIHAFIKDEPHKREKIETDRWRIISGMGATDQIVQRLFLEPIQKHLSTNPLITGAVMGLSPFQPGAARFLANKVLELRDFMGKPSKRIYSADKKFHDWTKLPYEFECVREFLDWLHDHESSWIRNIIGWIIRTIGGEKVFDLMGLKRKTPNGIMISGCFVTLLLNTLFQLVMHYNAEALLEDKSGEQVFAGDLLAGGDDTVQGEPPPGYWDSIRELGATLKPLVVTDPRDFEFLGFVFYQEENGLQFRPAYPAKHGYTLSVATSEELQEVLVSYQWLYMYSPDRLKFIHSLMEELGVADKKHTFEYMERTVRGKPLGFVTY